MVLCEGGWRAVEGGREGGGGLFLNVAHGASLVSNNAMMLCLKYSLLFSSLFLLLFSSSVISSRRRVLPVHI